MQSSIRFNYIENKEFIHLVLNNLPNYSTFCVLHSNEINSPLLHDEYDFIVSLGSQKQFQSNNPINWDFFNTLEQQNCFLMGFISYAYNKDFWKISEKKSTIAPPANSFWFAPKYLIYKRKEEKEFVIYGENPSEFYHSILQSQIAPLESSPEFKHEFLPLLSKEKYIHTIEKIREDIKNGEYYEINYCQEFISNKFNSDPFLIWEKIRNSNKAPFSAFFRHHSFFSISLSPERFLKRKANILLSQPIKGTAMRGGTELEDEKNKSNLQNSEKERAENIMIVDLVRNDLSRVCEVGTVSVEELCGIYSFKNVHQMISTISGKQLEKTKLGEILKNTFPMGSMTGAPKRMVVERASEYEVSARGLYSGSIGYLESNGNFDLNVVIRTLIIDTEKKIASFHVGGAITYDSDPFAEYDECMLKGKFWLDLFKNN
jgi:para-aminobenzoate synthetase component 1